MDRAEKTGLGLAVAGHVVLFGLLSVGFLSTPNPVKLKQQPIDVSLVKDVGLEATAPQAVTPPAQSIAPDQGEPEDAAPPAAEPLPQVEPEPRPAPPPPEPTPPRPAARQKPAPAPKPAPVPPKPQPKPPAATKPSPPKPQAQPRQTAAAAAARSRALDAAMKGIGESADAKTPRPRGSRLGNDFLKGLSSEPSKSTSTTPRAAKIDARAMASIVQAIARQIQPCADRQVNPGPGANQIVTKLDLRLNEDGTLAATPRMISQTGIDGENGRYSQRVVDLGVAAFKGCSPLKLPAEYYSTPSGGWNHIVYNWQLR